MDKICDRQGDKEAFDERKLYASIYYPAKEADYTDEEAEDLAESVTEELKEWIEEHEDSMVTTKEIRQKAIDVLEEKDEDVGFLYETHLDVN